MEMSGGWGHSRDGALRKRLGVVPGPPTFVTLLWREGKTTSLQRTLASQPFGGAYEGRELVMERGHAAGEMRILKKASVYFSFFFCKLLGQSCCTDLLHLVLFLVSQPLWWFSCPSSSAPARRTNGAIPSLALGCLPFIRNTIM